MRFPFTRKLNEQQPAQETPSQPVDLAAEFRCLWTVSQFFTVLQRLQLQPERGRTVDLTELGRKLEEVRQMRRTAAFGRLVGLQREINQARVELYEVDTTIPVNIMRRFFERLGRFDRAALGEVVRYYLSKPLKSQDDRDKVDLLVTRYGSYRVEAAADYATWRSIDGIGQQLTLLHPNPNDIPSGTRERTLEDLREMRNVVFGVKVFGDLIERKIVTHLRDYKTGLGELFFFPAVLAEILEINVTVHNKFQELYHTEMIRLQLEADRLSRVQQDVSRLLPALDSHRALSELGAMGLQMQQVLQEVKKDIAERLIVDRDVRISVEEDGVPLKTLVDSCEEALAKTADLVKQLHGAFTKAELRATPGQSISGGG